MAKIVLFVDALEPREYGKAWQKTERGKVISGHPKVTPKVTSEVYTGKSPSQNGMGSSHSISEMTTHRPLIPTIQEKLEMAGYNVGSFHMPYCLPLQLQNQMWVSEAMGEKAAGQHPLAQQMVSIPTAGDLKEGEEQVNLGLNTRQEQILSRSANMLSLIPLAELDVVFIGVRSPDEFTHFSQGGSHRQKLQEVIAGQIARWEVNHDVLWWSDHGAEEKEETFRVNKWLCEKGYLDLDIDMEFHEKLQDMNNGEDGPEIENQIGIQSPAVTINDGSEVVCVDPYDSCLDVIGEDVDRHAIKEDMMDTGYYDSVQMTENVWGEGEYLEQCPDILTHRADNVLVTSNVHPEPIGMGFYRTGVHSAEGAWGTTDTEFEREGDVVPKKLHDVIWQFVTGRPSPEEETLHEINNMAEQMKNAIGGE